MKERPILFSAPMVRALLAGTKTQTRRAVKPQPVYADVAGAFASWQFHRKGGGTWLWPNAREDVLASCPYGQPGDRLWVRETYTMAERLMSLVKTPCYKADEGITENNRMPDGSWPWKWTPAIHMFRAHSRLTLEIVSVRVERLQDISEADAMAEGCPDPLTRPIAPATICYATARTEYMAVWEKINGGGSWAANPWVWVVAFKRVP